MPTSLGLHIAAWGCSLVVLLGALAVVSLDNLFRAALSLGVVLLGVAALFVLLEADFLAFVQILVYVGAILTLVVFAVMLTARAHAATSPDAAPVSSSRQQLPAAIVSVGLFGILMLVTRTLLLTVPIQSATPVDLQTLGRELITKFVLPFEVVSLVFVAALVGSVAVALTKPRPAGAPVAGRRP